MYLTQINVIRGLTKEEYFQLRELCFFSNCLYNVALYNVRQQYFENKTYLKYTKNEPLCKENENYRLMQSNCAQQTIRIVDQAFKSFFALLELAKAGKYDYKKIRIPKYRPKGGLFNYIIQGNSISVRDGYLTIPLSREYTALRGKDKVKIKVPERLIGKKICEVKIIPKYNGRYFKITYCYEVEEEDLQLNQENSLAIDIGLDNLATCVTSTGTSFIMDGRLDNEELRMRNAELIMRQRYLQLISKRTNQQFVQMSFGKLRSQLKSLCERYSMKYIEQEESYTSKASFLDLDEIPIYQTDCQEKYNFSGKRIYRGLYRSKDERILNADVNGAANILRKSKQNLNIERLCRGLLVRPLRIRLS